MRYGNFFSKFFYSNPAIWHDHFFYYFHVVSRNRCFWTSDTIIIFSGVLVGLETSVQYRIINISNVFVAEISFLPKTLCIWVVLLLHDHFFYYFHVFSRNRCFWTSDKSIIFIGVPAGLETSVPFAISYYQRTHCSTFPMFSLLKFHFYAKLYANALFSFKFILKIAK